jgi:hypothetical protein
MIGVMRGKTIKIQSIGDAAIARLEFAKALLMFTPFSGLLVCKGESHHRKISQERMLAGSVLAVVQPNADLDFLWQIAALAECNGDEGRFRQLLGQAFKVAKRREAELLSAPQYLFSLVHFHNRLLDFASARRVIAAARPAAPLEANELSAKTEALEAECAAWMPAIEQARQAFRDRVDGKLPIGRDNEIDIYIPANAFGMKAIGYQGFQQDIRRAFSQVISILEEANCAYRPQLRLATHGRVPDESRAFVSYHSVSATGIGLHIKESERRACFSADSRGYSGWSAFAAHTGSHSSAVADDEINSFIHAERTALIGGNISKYDQPEARGMQVKRPYVFVALQVMDDAVQRLSHMHMFDMLEEVSQHCAAIGVEVVVKRHPKCASPAMTVALRRGEKRRKFIRSSASVHDLISGAMAVCTINSSVGAEALLHGKPVYLFGAAEYQHGCFQVKTRGDFAKLFVRGALPRPQKEIDALLYALRHEYSVNVRDDAQAKAFFYEKLTPLIKSTKSGGAG